MNWSISIILFSLIMTCATAQARSLKSPNHNCTGCHSLSLAEAGKILKELGEVKNVGTSPAKGLWEVTLEKDGRQAVVHIDFAKKLLVTGPVFEIATEKQLTPTPIRQKEMGGIDVSSIPLTNAVLMGNPEGKKKLFLFTDPDCPFCRKMHAELVNLEQIEPDVAIYVLLSPRPNHPGSYDKSRAILAGKSRALLDKAFSGKEIISRPDSNDGRRELDEIVHFARFNGITARPSLVLANGTILDGFRDAASLKKLLAGKSAMSVATK